MKCTHIDTCLPDYLTDHHNRDGELLIGVSVDRYMTNDTVRQALGYELTGIEDSRFDSNMYKAARTAITEAFADAVPHRKFDAKIELPTSDDEEWPQAWFLISWDA